MTYLPKPGDGANRVVTLIPGDGIGPCVMESVVAVVDALKAPITWERCRNQLWLPSHIVFDI